MRTPKATYDLSINAVPDEHLSENAWSAILDGRYKIEVQRTEPYQGVLCVWDGKNNDKLMLEQVVGISYNAQFGPDVADLSMWQDTACKLIDGATLPSVS